jgi:hypothetical protein
MKITPVATTANQFEYAKRKPTLAVVKKPIKRTRDKKSITDKKRVIEWKNGEGILA